MEKPGISKTIRILFAEDEAVHYIMAVKILQHEGLDFESVRVEARNTFLDAIESFCPDLVITDYMMPDFNGMDVLKLTRDYNQSIPVIILTGAISEEIAVECMRLGASNYVLKNNLIRLPFAVKEALKKREAVEEASTAIQHLKESESRLNTITNAAGDAIIMLDENGLISFWNPAAEKIFGYSREEAVGQDLHTLIVPENYRKIFSTKFPAFQQSGQGAAVGKTLELKGIHKNGSELTISLTLSAVKIQNRWHAVGIVLDISERKKFEFELIAAKEKAEASDKLKTAFINNISHEVRTPLNGILGFSELITQDSLSNEEKEQFRSLIKVSSTRLLNTITNYMDIALLMSNNMVVREKPFELNRQLYAIKELFQPLCQVKKLTLILQIPENIAELILPSDREFHWKILSHLMDNAVKFTHHGTITFGYSPGNGGIDYFVADTGIGIASELHSKVFENFRQGEVSNTRDYEGSGLGLSIARGLARLLGGDITVESSRGAGAVFSIFIPYSKIEIEKTKQNIPTPIHKTPEIQVVLLAEDDTSNYFLEEQILKKAGFQVIPATNGKEAVEQCQKHPEIALALMDMKMPVMDGFEATRRIKEFRNNLPIIAVTAFAMSGDEKKALDAGCDDYITKPLVEKNLLKMLESYGLTTKR
ncbi:MAG: response regulator [Bacteroidetes bacterium]|nr:response regulator [Bacteroidota bacterium]